MVAPTPQMKTAASHVECARNWVISWWFCGDFIVIWWFISDWLEDSTNNNGGMAMGYAMMEALATHGEPGYSTPCEPKLGTDFRRMDTRIANPTWFLDRGFEEPHGLIQQSNHVRIKFLYYDSIIWILIFSIVLTNCYYYTLICNMRMYWWQH